MEQWAEMLFMVCSKQGKSTLLKQVPNEQQVAPAKPFQIIKYLKENPCRIQQWIKDGVGVFADTFASIQLTLTELAYTFLYPFALAGVRCLMPQEIRCIVGYQNVAINLLLYLKTVRIEL